MKPRPGAIYKAGGNSVVILQAKAPAAPAVVEAVVTAAPQQVQVLMDEVTKQVRGGKPCGRAEKPILIRLFLVSLLFFPHLVFS